MLLHVISAPDCTSSSCEADTSGRRKEATHEYAGATFGKQRRNLLKLGPSTTVNMLNTDLVEALSTGTAFMGQCPECCCHLDLLTDAAEHKLGMGFGMQQRAHAINLAYFKVPG